MFCDDIDLLVILIGILLLGADSVLNPIGAGAMLIVAAPVVMTSATTPDPGVGSVVIVRDSSTVRSATLVYTLIHAAVLVWIV